MRKGLFLLGFAFTVLSGAAQNGCKVLMPSVSVNYSGECKNGLADGYGEAYGTDHYKGKFKKGWPHGKGTYTWVTGEVYRGEWKKGMRHGQGSYTFFVGDRDSTITGRWVRDKYVGTGNSELDYQVLYKNNIGRITVTRIGDGREIRFKFLRNGGEVPVSNLLLYGDSGSELHEWAMDGFEDIEFPFTTKVIFSVANDFGAATLKCELRLKILKPGTYQVYIYL